jgi:ketosteroid isomerase-like protein
MRMKAMSRRTLIGAAPYALAASAGLAGVADARAEDGLSATSDATIRRWYAAWERDDWLPIDRMLTEDFTFSSAAGDDHINKSAFKAQCWESQKNFIERFDLLRIFGRGDEAVVLYECHTRNGQSFRNVEYFRLKDAKVQALECYFGGRSSFPSAVSARKE